MPAPLNVPIDPGQILVNLTYALQVIFLLILVGGILFVIWRKRWFVKFPTTAMIFRMRGKKMFVVDEDRARRVKNRKDGEIYYEFKKRPGIKWKPPSFEFLSPTTRNKSVMYLKELAQDDFEIIDPKAFLSTSPKDYKKVEHEEVDRFFKNIQDEKARIKWRQESSIKKLMEALPLIMSIMGVALFFYIFGQYVAIPIINQYSGMFAQAAILNEQSQLLLDKSTSYVELLLRQQGGQQIVTQYVCPDKSIVSNPDLCA